MKEKIKVIDPKLVAEILKYCVHSEEELEIREDRGNVEWPKDEKDTVWANIGIGIIGLSRSRVNEKKEIINEMISLIDDSFKQGKTSKLLGIDRNGVEWTTKEIDRISLVILGVAAERMRAGVIGSTPEDMHVIVEVLSVKS